MMFVFCPMIDAKEFASDVVTSLVLYRSIPRFGTMLTKKVLASAFSDVITVDFSFREIVLHVLALFLNNGLTVFQDFIMSVTLC